jgi:Peptidase family M23
MTKVSPSRSSMVREIVISLPFTGLWLARNSPARRIPSHGTDLFGERYAIDFIGVDHRRRTADRRDWRTFVASEPAERFFAYGRPILAPADGTVVDVHDGEIDHVGRRSQLALVPYALGQQARLRQGVGAIAGNYLIIALRGKGVFVALVHLQAGSIRVVIGDEVATGQTVANCGNSGNSTQPHVHVQVMDSPELSIARGVPMAFQRFREWPRGAKHPTIREFGLPGEGAVVEPLPLVATDANAASGAL